MNDADIEAKHQMFNETTCPREPKPCYEMIHHQI